MRRLSSTMYVFRLATCSLVKDVGLRLPKVVLVPGASIIACEQLARLSRHWIQLSTVRTAERHLENCCPTKPRFAKQLLRPEWRSLNQGFFAIWQQFRPMNMASKLPRHTLP